MGEVGGLGVEVIHVAADSPPPDGQREWDRGVAVGEMEVLLKFAMDGGVEITMTQGVYQLSSLLSDC